MVNGNDNMNPQSSLSKFKSSLVVSLTDSAGAAAGAGAGGGGNKDDKEDGHGHDAYYPPTVVGGKASSLAKLFATEGVSTHVPKSYALTVAFFHYWIEELQHTTDYQLLVESIRSGSSAEDLCKKLQEKSWTLAPTNEQSEAIQMLVDAFTTTSIATTATTATATNDAQHNPVQLAIRSSAPEEDGTGASFAGAFDTKLGIAVRYEAIVTAVHACFASLWDYRVLDYKLKNTHHASAPERILDEMGFAVVVMEMINSDIAGVAFTANPLNSDRDECVIDSSWGLGESVVDGSVTADRYIVNKIDLSIRKEIVGIKGIEKRLDYNKEEESGDGGRGGRRGGVIETILDENDPKRTQSSLSHDQLKELTKLVCLVEKTYGMPMDVEWAVIYDQRDHDHDHDLAKTSTDSPNTTNWELKLLQARPITTLYTLDEFMMTEPGEKRKLYFDHNILSAATTINPFTTLDLEFMSKFPNYIFSIPYNDMKLIGMNSDSFRFNSSTRQYFGVGYMLKLKSPKEISEKINVVDSYASSIFASSDCDASLYTASSFPPGIFSFLSTKVPLLYKLLFTIGTRYKENPKLMKAYNQNIVQNDMDRLNKYQKEHRQQQQQGSSSSLEHYIAKICSSICPSLKEEMECNFGVVVPTMNGLNQMRNDESLSKELRNEYEDLCGGYIGDELMMENISMFKLANSLDESVWKEYDDGDNGGWTRMLDAINSNSLPLEFMILWKEFMENYGFDGQDQLFVSCPRYQDSPELLLGKLKMNALGHIKDPAITQKEQVSKRRAAMEKHVKEAEAAAVAASTASWLSSLYCRSSDEKTNHYGSLAEVKKRNEILENLMWIRNAPKMHLTKLVGIIRIEVLRIQEKLLNDERLDSKGDIFHLNVKEIDDAIQNVNIDLMESIRPRKAAYERALRSTECPILVDSRCRILRPDPPTFKDGEEPPPGTLIGAAMAPGVAKGRVRIVNDPSETFLNGEVLCAVVTGPAWTPMFACASAVVLQVGGVLQHGALCAREYAKPAVSSIDIHALLKDGMMVSVDGNTGIVKILDQPN